MTKQDPVEAILQVHADLAAHSIMKAPRHPAVAAGTLKPEDVLRELVVILVRAGVNPASILEAVHAAIEDADG